MMILRAAKSSNKIRHDLGQIEVVAPFLFFSAARFRVAFKVDQGNSESHRTPRAH
jgi:hypothetical protein